MQFQFSYAQKMMLVRALRADRRVSGSGSAFWRTCRSLQTAGYLTVPTGLDGQRLTGVFQLTGRGTAAARALTARV